MPSLRQHIGKDSRSLQLSGKAISGKYRKKQELDHNTHQRTILGRKGKKICTYILQYDTL